jgi:hypothetical protein
MDQTDLTHNTVTTFGSIPILNVARKTVVAGRAAILGIAARCNDRC